MEGPNQTNTPPGLQQISTVLHDLCQPLTTLQCRLEMAQLLDTLENYREEVAAAVAESACVSRHVHALRDVLRKHMSELKSEN